MKDIKKVKIFDGIKHIVIDNPLYVNRLEDTVEVVEEQSGNVEATQYHSSFYSIQFKAKDIKKEK